MLSHLETAIAMVSCSESVRLQPGLTRCIFLFTIRHSCQIWCVFSFMVCLSLVSDQVYIIVPGLSYYASDHLYIIVPALSDYSVWSFIFSLSLPIRLQWQTKYIFAFWVYHTPVSYQVFTDWQCSRLKWLLFIFLLQYYIIHYNIHSVFLLLLSRLNFDCLMPDGEDIMQIQDRYKFFHI